RAVLPVAKKVYCVLGRVMRRVEKLLELRVRDRILVDIERRSLHDVLMIAARRVLPWILHVDARIVTAFDLGAAHAKIKSSARNADHAARRFGSGSGGFDGHDLLRQDCGLMRERNQRLGRDLCHALHQRLDLRTGFTGRCENGAIAIRFKIEAQYGALLFNLRTQLHAVIEVEVAHTRSIRYIHLASGDVVRCAIHDGPHGFFVKRPAARISAVVAHRIEWLPAGADEKGSDATLDRCDAARGFGVAWIDAVPDAPHVLPALPADAVEEGEL